MTGERASELLPGPSTPLSPSGILDLCDRLLDEVGRRHHLFAWLRPPGSGMEDWLVVDAYYPANRLVVIWREERREHDHLYAELVPERGLRLLALRPEDLGGESDGVEQSLRRMLEEVGLGRQRASTATQREPVAAPERGPRRPPAPPARRPPAVAAARRPVAPPQSRRISPAQAAAAQRAARFAQSRKSPTPRKPPPRRTPAIQQAHPRPRPRRLGSDAETLGLFVGLTLVAILLVEMYLDVITLAIDDGQIVLAFGVAIDACSRALGTIAAGRAGRRDWAWGCALGGSPAVAVFALFQPEGRVSTEPAPLAGLLAVLAVLVIVLSLLGVAFGV